MTLRFDKYEGLGNDFVIPEVGTELDATFARSLCDRHRGIGADGVLVLGRDADGQPSMRVYNADGSVPQMCGNGLRCVALHLFTRGAVDGSAFVVSTDAGPHRVQVHGPNDVEVWMRPASLAPADLPLRAEAPWVDTPLDVGGAGPVRLTAVSMGNPHAVTFDDVGARRETLGPAIEHDAHFPEKVNVGFASMSERGLDLAVWERGVGWTQACGTGACAAAVAAVHTGRASRDVPLAVHLPGGTLTIVVSDDRAPIRMRGPATHVFRGEIAR